VTHALHPRERAGLARRARAAGAAVAVCAVGHGPQVEPTLALAPAGIAGCLLRLADAGIAVVGVRGALRVVGARTLATGSAAGVGRAGLRRRGRAAAAAVAGRLGLQRESVRAGGADAVGTRRALRAGAVRARAGVAAGRVVVGAHPVQLRRAVAEVRARTGRAGLAGAADR